jgi:hypothetical protein
MTARGFLKVRNPELDGFIILEIHSRPLIPLGLEIFSAGNGLHADV